MNRQSPLVMVARTLGLTFGIMLLIGAFFNVLSGVRMFALVPMFFAAVLLTVIMVVIGWVVVTVGTNILHSSDPQYQDWKKKGGKIYWDSLPWPINSASAVERRTGLAEPKYTNFVPPISWVCQCPVCGARVAKPVDVCWNCNYGADGDSTAYVQRWGEVPFVQQPMPKCNSGSCAVPQPTPVQTVPPDWRPMK